MSPWWKHEPTFYQDIEKVARAKEKLEQAINELRRTLDTVEAILEEADEERGMGRNGA